MPSAKTTKKKAPNKSKPKTTGTELSEEQLEHVAGGAVDYFLKLDGIQGESQEQKHSADDLTYNLKP
jgi:hypothetical protein